MQLVDLIFEALFQCRFGVIELLFHGFDFSHSAFVFQRDLPPLAARQILQHGLGNLGISVHTFRAGSHLLAGQQTFEAVVNITLQNRQFIVAVFCQRFNFLPLDCQGAFVLVNAVAVKHPHFHDRAGGAGRQFQGGIAHIRGFFAENSAQKFFFRRHRAFAFGRNFANQNIARVHFRTDIDNASFVEIAQCFLADIWNIAGDFFRPKLGVAGHDLELLNVN